MITTVFFFFFFLKSTWWEINKDECRTVLWWHARRALAWQHYCLEPLLFLAHSMSTVIFQSGRLHADFYNWQTFYRQNSHVQYKLVQNCRLVGFPIVFLVLQSIIDHAGTYLCTIWGGCIANREHGGSSKRMRVYVR